MGNVMAVFSLWPKQIALMAVNKPVQSAAMLEGEDETLFGRVCSSGDHAAYAVLVKRYRHRVIGLIQRMMSNSGGQARADVEDLAQDAFVEAFQKRSTFRKGSAFRPWLYRIAVNKCLDKLRSSKRYGTLELLPNEDVVGEGDPLSAVLQREHMGELDAAVAALPPKHRAVLVLRYIDDLSYEEIALAADLPIGTVKTYLFRARAELRRTLDNAS